MFISIIVCLLAISLFVSFLNGLVSELNQDVFSKIISENPKSKLQKIWDKYDEITNSLKFIHTLTFVLAILFYGLTTNLKNIEISYLLVFIIASVFILLLLFLNLMLYFLGKRYSEKSIISFINFIIFLTFPFVKIAEKMKLICMQISGKVNDDDAKEELTNLMEEAREDGSIDADEYRIFKNIMNFKEVYVTDVMTPRIVLFSCNANMTIPEALKLPELQMYSRIPIWEGESIDDEIIGYVTTKEIFNAALNGFNDKQLKELARPIHFIPETAELGKALETFLLKKQQLLLVVDEYGGIEGLISMEDIVETILGVEIVDEADKIVDLRVLAKSRRENRIKENYQIDSE
jgi:CBS domain containing-hemolysin-like protein